VKKIYLHIGAGKTGTSALQSQLAINRNRLMDHGYFYPEAKSDKLSSKFRISSGNAVELGRELRSDNFNKKAICHIIENIVNNARGNDIILSSEVMQAFKLKNAEFFKNIVNQLGYEIIVIYYVRAIADHVVSSYHQLLKRHNYSEDFDIFIDGYIKRNKKRFLNVVERSIEVFGKDNLILKNYDKVKNNLFKDFLNDILKIENYENFEIINKRVNRSLTEEEVVLMKEFNKYCKAPISSKFISDALIHSNPESNYRMYIDKKSLDIITLMYDDEVNRLNLFLKESEKPLKIVENLNILEDVSDHKMDAFQKSIVSILAEIVKNITKT